MSVGSAVAVSSVKQVVEYLLKKRGGPEPRRLVKKRIRRGVEDHLKETSRWASEIQLFGMNPRSTGRTSIGLQIATQARRFRTVARRRRFRSEANLLSDRRNYLLLGDPGSGKTTTLKRLTRRLLQPPRSNKDAFAFPFVLRLRELEPGESLFTRIARVLQLRYGQREVIVQRPQGRRASLNLREMLPTHMRGGIREHATTMHVTHIETRIGDQLIDDAIAGVLDEIAPVLLLDGLDEIPADHRAQLRSEVVQLGRKLRASKIIISCRSGDYTGSMEGFYVVEICPLQQEQIRAIAKRWIKRRTDTFLTALSQVPYHDLIDRPLLLIQLLVVFKRYGSLPEQPAHIYKKVIRLLLEDWDADHEIVRHSQYAGFGPERKLEFLATLAYHITYNLRQKTFSEAELITAYHAIHHSFRLPKNEACKVAQELQTHTGIIAAGPRDTYEFSHLSLQEYLCASHLIRSTLVTAINTRLAAYPAPLAVAATLSSTPNNWFASLILQTDILNAMNATNLISFLSRLATEQPAFGPTEPLGFALLRLCYYSREDPRIEEWILKLSKPRQVKEAFAAALRWYSFRETARVRGGFVLVDRQVGLTGPYTFEPPHIGAIPGSLLPEVVKVSTGRIEFIDRHHRKRKLTASIAEKIASEGVQHH